MISKAMTSQMAGAAGGGARLPRVGLFPPFDLLERGEKTARTFLAQAGEAGIDHVCCGDHVSFAGAGFDGLVQATALTLLHPTLPIYSGVYLLPLRHPVLVARQLADISRLAPGRLIFGVAMAAHEAARTVRPDPPARHGMQLWCGLADSKEAARACLAPAMQAFYQLPFERFERYCPYGTAADVAEFLTPYLDAGCTEFNLIPQSPDCDQAMAGTAAVKRLLART
ncbi:MAG TPA: LLM class flavin-dependent oxidoreductase [Streptosporangiaceae bacterium]|nr:LLM class flavin-dependent oxidoreductase [Streptosporangiaceae bacterium]